ncbi:hypothetical protein FJTKL_13867 [Diaporthe vaccinii]|uniref:Major facilitator superfamily (MFS) profile domain-containing protein n=1 Tax=Diaporthe vaccinii TaxID=105482 RepID=A0ABR4F962_9PEZI
MHAIHGSRSVSYHLLVLILDRVTHHMQGSSSSTLNDRLWHLDPRFPGRTKSALVLAYTFIFVNSCLTSMEQQTTANLLPFVVSDFSAHSLIPAIGIASFILSGVLRLPVAKIIDTWGRPQGLAAMFAIATVGLAMMAGCSSAATYAAAQILHAVGFSGFTYILDIIVADTSSLQDRTLAFAFAGSPAIVTNFLGPPTAQWFLRNSSWRAAFALFTVLTPLVAFPVLAILQANANRTKKLGILKPSKSERTWSEAIWHYSVEFDGSFILSASLFIAYYCWDGYYTSYLQVVHQLSVYQAGYVNNTYTIIMSGVLMVFFRQPSTPLVWVILPQILQALGGGTLVMTMQMAVMAVAKHGEVASLIALLGLSSAVGSGIGSSVSGAIWTNTVYAELLRLLPDDSKDQVSGIYEDLQRQLSYPVGSPVRDPIVYA